MPTPSATVLQIVKNGGAPASGVVTAAFSDTILLKLEDPSGVKKVRYRIWDYPDGFPLPSGWTDSGARYYYVDKLNGADAPLVTLPDGSNPDLWGKYMFDALVNDGKRNGAMASDLFTNRTCLKIPSANGIEDVAYQEEDQFDTQRHYVSALKSMVRFVDRSLSGGSALPSPGAAGNQLTSDGAGHWVSAPDGSIDITSFAAVTPTVEVGATVSNPAFTATINRTPTTSVLTNNKTGESKDVHATPTSFASSASHTFSTVGDTWTFTDTVGDGITTDAANASIVARQKNFAGLVTVGNTSPATLAAAATYAVLDGDGAFNFTLTDDGTHEWQFMRRAAYGTPSSVKDHATGFGVSYTLVGTSSYTNAQGFAENFNLYKLDVAVNGTVQIDVT